MKWITRYFITKSLQQAQDKRNKKAAAFTGVLTRIGIIASSPAKLQETREAIQIELGPDIQLTGLFYDERTDAQDAFSFRDFSLTGKPRGKISAFLANNPDVIIASSENLNIFSLYLLYLNPQSYSVGFYQENHTPYLDLMLAKEGEGSKENMENLLKYLKQVILK